MNKGILIALLVPAIAVAAPKKRPRRKANPPPTPTEEKKKDEPAEEAAATPDAGSATPTTPATKPGTTPAATPTTPATGGPLTTKPGLPAANSGGTTPAPPQTTPPAKEDKEPEEPKGKEVDVDSLRQEYLSLRDELFKSRARANAVASALYSTRMTIKFTWGSARHYGVSKASIRVDGATVYEDSAGGIANDDGIRFNGYVAPGRHLVTFHVEATGKDDDSFTSSTESQVVVKAVANKDLLISAKGHDSGDIAYEWKRSEKGSYGLGIDVAVKTAAGAAGAKK